jgi:hypothetical protein
MHKSRIAAAELLKSRYDKSPKLVDEEHAKIIWEKNNMIATIIVDGKEMRSELYTQIAVLQTQNRDIDRLFKENNAFRKKESKMRLLLSDQNAPAKKRCAI